MNKNLVSVIIPMYNSEKTITHVLESVRKQTVVDCIKEIIIVNDGSTDNSEYIVNSYTKYYENLPIRLITQENGGVSKARNAGLKIATGKYIALLDSDDVWTKNKLERQLNILEKNPQIYFLGAGVNNLELRLYFWKKVKGLYKAKPRDVCWKTFPATSTVVFRRDCLKEVGYFDETRRYGEDLQFFQKFFKNYNYYYLAESLEQMAIHKVFYGEKGLTSNLKEMHEGRQRDLDELYEMRMISKNYYNLMKIFNNIKFVRRTILTKYYGYLRRNKSVN